MALAHSTENRYGYSESRNLITCGQWDTEVESVSALTDFLDRTGLFRLFHEVRGRYLQPRLGQEDKSPRIDLLVWPTSAAIDRGWNIGPVGIECKRSGEKLGKPIAQLQDYSRAAWLVDEQVHNWTILDWLFLWPAEQTSGPLNSVLAQNRLGTAEFAEAWGRGQLLRLASGGVVAEVTHDGQIRMGPGRVAGKKAGAR